MGPRRKGASTSLKVHAVCWASTCASEGRDGERGCQEGKGMLRGVGEGGGGRVRGVGSGHRRGGGRSASFMHTHSHLCRRQLDGDGVGAVERPALALLGGHVQQLSDPDSAAITAADLRGRGGVGEMQGVGGAENEGRGGGE